MYGHASTNLFVPEFEINTHRDAPKFHTGYIVHARIRNCFNTRGLRKEVHRSAVKHTGYYTAGVDREKSIGYVELDLVINVAFKREDQASLFKFEVQSLDEIDTRDRLVVDETITRYAGELSLENMMCIRHYRSGEYGSPPASFSNSSSVISTVASWSSLATYQSIEPLGYQGATRFQKCHLKSQCECSKEEKKNPNNMICLTPNVHCMIDGSDQVPPTLRIKATGSDSTPCECREDTGVMKTRYRVDLLIDFPSSEARDGFSGGFKDGSERVDAWTYKTFVHVYDAEEFMAFVAWKYKDTTDKWA